MKEVTHASLCLCGRGPFIQALRPPGPPGDCVGEGNSLGPGEGHRRLTVEAARRLPICRPPRSSCIGEECWSMSRAVLTARPVLWGHSLPDICRLQRHRPDAPQSRQGQLYGGASEGEPWEVALTSQPGGEQGAFASECGGPRRGADRAQQGGGGWAAPEPRCGSSQRPQKSSSTGPNVRAPVCTGHRAAARLRRIMNVTKSTVQKYKD